MSIGKICQRSVDFAEPMESVLQAAERMRDRSVGTLVILNKRRQPIGILTDRDITTRVVATARDATSTTIDEVMTREPTTASEGTPIEMALMRMRSGAFRRLPVVDENEELVGLVTLDDILGLMCEEFAAIGGLLERETPAAALHP